jgi:hypothetical protein
MGVVGRVTGMHAGSLAPILMTGLCALDGPEPPPTFSQVMWGSEQRPFPCGLRAGSVIGGYQPWATMLESHRTWRRSIGTGVARRSTIRASKRSTRSIGG